MHCNRDRDGQRRVGKPVIVDIIGKAVGPVRPGGDFRPGHPLRIVEQFVEIHRSGFRAIAVGELAEFPRARAAGGELGPQIADHPVGQTHVLFDQLDERVVLNPGREKLERRNPDSFLKNLG